MTDRTDEELVSATTKGDREAYAALVRRYSSRIYAVCLAMLRDPDDSQDIAQEALLRGMTRIQTLQEGSQFAVWITRIAQNLCRDHWRVQKRRQELLREHTQASEQVAEATSTDLPYALERLPEKHRTPLLLYYFDGQSSENVAKALNISRAGAGRRLVRAREALRKILERSHE